MKLNFTIAELCISHTQLIPIPVADKILEYHILPMQPIRIQLGFPIWASEHSGYRSPAYERKMKREYISPHQFKEKGAVDWTCDKKNFYLFVCMMIARHPYKRICLYPEEMFLHGDYLNRGHRLYINKKVEVSGKIKNQWKRVNEEEFKINTYTPF